MADNSIDYSGPLGYECE